jgi:hypothetical protein
MVTNSDMCKIESLCEVLEPFEESTDILGGQSYVTSLCVLVMLHNLIKALEPKVNEIRFIIHVKGAIKADLSERISNLGRNLEVFSTLGFRKLRFLTSERLDDMWERFRLKWNQ